MFGLDFAETLIVGGVVVVVAWFARSAYIRGMEMDNNLKMMRARETTRRNIMETRAMMQAEQGLNVPEELNAPSGDLMSQLMPLLGNPQIQALVSSLMNQNKGSGGAGGSTPPTSN